MDYANFRLRSFTTLESKYILTCGSFYELPIKYNSSNITDADVIFYYYDICAIPWNRNPPKNTKCTVLRIDSKQTPPGFARLIVDRDNTNDNPTYFRRPPVLRDIKTGGPSWPREQKLTHEFRALHKVNQNSIDHDIVFAIYCPYWPVEAEEWRKRKRFHGWPNEKLIARITRGGCHFVSKLRTWSSCDDTEWRFSFSKAELLLIHSWTPDQKFAYHAIRIIKRRISGHCGGDGNKGLQTYYFKTLMLWACEEFPPEFWSVQNIIICVKTLLLRFHKCLYEKFCPSYFIPECNIMSHLEDEGSFEKELQTLQIFLRNKIGVIVKICSSQSRVMPETSFEYNFLMMTFHSLPLCEKLNGRCAQYLSECEWFLPEMKNLHTGIEAHLRLMSVDCVTERQTSKYYAVCLENFDFALLKSIEFRTYEFLNTDMSITENWIKIFIRKLFRNSAVVYLRGNSREHELVNAIKESYPSILHGVTSAYRANFDFTAMKSYKESIRECEKCFDVFTRVEFGFAHQSLLRLSSYIYILLCNSLSQIFDEHLQAILGFATLHRNVTFFNSTINATCHNVCLKLNVWEFLKYICIQCQQKLYSVAELTDYSCPNGCYFDLPFVSQLIGNESFSTAILFAALQQSRAHKNPLKFKGSFNSIPF